MHPAPAVLGLARDERAAELERRRRRALGADGLVVLDRAVADVAVAEAIVLADLGVDLEALAHDAVVRREVLVELCLPARGDRRVVLVEVEQDRLVVGPHLEAREVAGVDVLEHLLDLLAQVGGGLVIRRWTAAVTAREQREDEARNEDAHGCSPYGS